jgi:hypothetical protein
MWSNYQSEMSMTLHPCNFKQNILMLEKWMFFFYHVPGRCLPPHAQTFENRRITSNEVGIIWQTEENNANNTTEKQ